MGDGAEEKRAGHVGPIHTYAELLSGKLALSRRI